MGHIHEKLTILSAILFMKNDMGQEQWNVKNFKYFFPHFLLDENVIFYENIL